VQIHVDQVVVGLGLGVVVRIRLLGGGANLDQLLAERLQWTIASSVKRTRKQAARGSPMMYLPPSWRIPQWRGTYWE
jgi:hypothetical protein